MTHNVSRRSFIGTAALTGAGLLAGCGGSGGDGTPTGSAPSEVAEYLSDTDNFDGSVTDETGSDSVSVDVGTEGNGGNFAFAPAAIRVDTGTTVTWVWTGEGQQHNVVHEDGDFESDQTAEEGFEFEYTFEEPQTCGYYCAPHESLGMKGAIIVE
jgi:halocyanin-like protein